MAAKTMTLSLVTCTITRPPARLATISFSLSPDWERAIGQEHSSERTRAPIPQNGRKRSVLPLFIGSLSYGDWEPGRNKELPNGRGRFRLRKEFVQRPAIKIFAASNHGGNLSCVTNVCEWIGVEQNQIRELPGFNRAEVPSAPQELRRSSSRRLQRFAGREARANQLGEFLVQAVSRKNKRV